MPARLNMLMLTLLKLCWKPLGIVLMIAAAWFAFNRYIDGVRDTAYNAGESASEARHKAELDKANEINREREKALESDLRAFSERFATLSEERHKREQAIVTKIDERIAASGDCAIDPEIITLRNRLRAE